MDTETLVGRPNEANAKLRLFSLYDNLAASIQARWIIGVITRMASPYWIASSEMWALDFIGVNPSINKLIVQGAIDADVLIVSLSSLEQQPASLIEWLEDLGIQQHPGCGLFIGLFGHQPHQAEESSWMAGQFMDCAQRMNRDFLWQRMRQTGTAGSSWLTNGVEKFLSRKQSLKNMPWIQEPATDHLMPQPIIR